MTQEEKGLLLKELSARLPYGVKVINTAEGVNEVCELDSIMTSRKHKDNIFVSLTLPDDSVMTGIEMIKPYLRPMSSMTEEEKISVQALAFANDAMLIFDWLHSHHFDCRGLIPKDLAIEAPEDMYKI